MADVMRDPRVLLAACLLHPLPVALATAIKEVLATAPQQQAEPVEAVACSNTFGCRCPKHFAAQQAEPVQAVATFDEVWAAIDWDKWRLQPIRELVRMIHSKTSPAAPVQQAEPVRDFRLAECVFVGPPPAPHEDWHHAISAMLREKHISGLRISTATADDWNGDKEQQRKPLTEEEIDGLMQSIGLVTPSHPRNIGAAARARRRIARAVEAMLAVREAK